MRTVLAVVLGLILLAPACNKNAPEANSADDVVDTTPTAESSDISENPIGDDELLGEENIPVDDGEEEGEGGDASDFEDDDSDFEDDDSDFE